MKLILGIGNPGPDYAGTRHNCGFAVLDLLAERHGCGFQKQKKWRSLVASLPGPDRAVLIKPQTFVNLSGQAAQAACAFHKVDPSDLLVVVDDIHLQLGQLRLRAQGSAGGHNGLKDIEARLGRAYPRLRLGIGAPGHDQVAHVLGPFAPAEREDAQAMLSKAADCVTCWLSDGVEAAMRFNGPLRPPAPTPDEPTTEDGDEARSSGA